MTAVDPLPLPLPLPMTDFSLAMDSDSSLSDLSSADLSSELSSVRAVSPPLGYPSPVSSQEQDGCPGLDDHVSKKRSRDAENAPIAKKRRKAEPAPRTTVHLDLTSNTALSAADQKEQCDLLLKVLRKRRKIVVVAGAGISVSAGIPDFRSSTGLFTTLRSEHKLKASGKHLFDASVYQTDSSTSSFHDMVRSLSNLVSVAQPTEFHKMLSTLGSEGRLLRLYTQNVDGIDVALPSLETSVPLSSKGPWPRSIQLHGGLEKMVCSKCNHLSDFQPELFSGPVPPPCTVCVETDRVRTDHAGKRSHGIGRLRPRMVLYNEHNPDEDAIGAVVGSDLRARPDAVIVVGTSMKIPGVRRIVREMCGVVRGRRDGLAVWINHDPPPLGKEFEDCWDLVVKGPCDEVARQWARCNGGDSSECTESEVERAKKRFGNVEVRIEAADTPAIPGVLTPAASPRPKQKINLIVKPKGQQKALLKSVVKKPVGRPPSKTKKAPADGSSTKASNAKIKFRTTKPSLSTAKSTASKAAQLKNPTHAMEPISPAAARNNGPLQMPPRSMCSEFSLAVKIETPAKAPRERWSTISPPSSPRGLEHCIDWSGEAKV